MTKKSNEMEKLMITPKTKIFDLLQAYPQLEDVLIALAPPFKKLKNPVLRKTIAKITTLSQAAVIGGVKVNEIVVKLRTEIGQATTNSIQDEGGNYVTNKPVWFRESKIIETMDVRGMINAGEHPVHDVLAAIKKLQSGYILKIIVPFIPAPLIDKAKSLNSEHWVDKKGEEEFWVYFKV